MVSTKKRWVKTDDYHGYYEYEDSVYSATIPIGNPEMIKDENEKIKKIKNVLKEKKISFKIVNEKPQIIIPYYDVLVDKQNAERATKMIEKVI
jgi:hypothetical protein